MRVTCERAALAEAISLINGVVATRSPRPQLGCVKIEATETAPDVGQLVLAGTDAEISLRVRLDRVNVEQPGEALIPADRLAAIVRAEDGDTTLSLHADGESCEIKGSDARFKVFGFPPTDFPEIPTFGEIASGAGGARPAKSVFEHDAGRLDSTIGRTLFATARENSRYAINGVLLTREGKAVRLVATDGRRLALCKTQLDGAGTGDENVSCIVPTKALSLLQKLIDEPDESVRVAVADNQVAFELGGSGDDEGRAVLTTGLVEGAFPPYEDVIPKSNDIRAGFDRDLLASAVRRAALLTTEDSRGVRMAFNAADQQLTLTSRSPEMGEAEVGMGLSSYDGDDIEIGFNPGFITEALKVVADPELVFELTAPNKPGLIRSGSDFVYVVMPVNL